MSHTVVVGAGPSGLAIALGLAARGTEVRVLERSERVGGRVHTIVRDGHSIELGPAGILDGSPETRALLAALGPDAPSIVPASSSVSRRYLVRDGVPRALPMRPAGLLLGSPLSLAERMALLREPFVKRRLDPAPESVADFAVRRFGAALAETLAQPLVLGVFGSDYAVLELGSAFPALRDYESEHGSVLRGIFAEARARRRTGEPQARLISFEGGMGALPQAMARALGERVRLGAGVRGIEQRAGRTVLRLDDGSECRCARVVLATEPETAATLLAPVDAQAANGLRSLGSTPIASVTLGYPKAAVAHPLDGFGLLVPRRERLRTMGVLFMTSIFPTARLAPHGVVLLRAMVGGANDPRVLELADPALLEETRRELASLLQIDGAPTFSHVQRWPRAIAQYTLGHGHRRVEIEQRARAHDIYLGGTALYGVGVNDVLRDAARVVERMAASTAA